MKRIFCLILVFVSLFAVVSCGSKKKVEPDEGNKPLPEEEVTKEVSAEEGGTVANEDESVSIEIPSGALEDDTTITMKIYDAKGYPGTEGKTVISKIVEFEPSGTVFKKPVVISMISTGTEEITRAAQKKVVTAAVYRETKGEWSYSPTGAAVKITDHNEGGDPIMTTAAGDPIMLNAAGDPIMQSTGAMLSAAGDPIMITAAGDPIMTAAAGDPIMMTTGHFTAYAFFYIDLEVTDDDADTTEDDDDIIEITDEDEDIEIPDENDEDIEIEDEDEPTEEVDEIPDIEIPDENDDTDVIVPEPEPELLYSKVLCTGMTICTDNKGHQILCPEEGEEFSGQDAQYASRGSCVPNHSMDRVAKSEFVENNFFEVKDEATGLTWIFAGTTGSYDSVENGCDFSYAGKENWRFPTPKELMTFAQNDGIFRGVPADPIYFYPDKSSSEYGLYFWSSVENYLYALEYGQVIPPKAYENYKGYFSDGYLMCVSGEEYGKVKADNYTSITRSGDEMVFDSGTNLYWQKDSGKAETWKDALHYCENLEYAGFSDWRLPNKNELLTLVDYSKTGTEVPSSFPGMTADVFWSSTGADSYPWVLDMSDGTVYTFNGCTAGGFYIMRHSESPVSVRCVRSKLDEKTDFPACNKTGIAPCKDADGTIWSSALYVERFKDFDHKYLYLGNSCSDDEEFCPDAEVDWWGLPEMCRNLNEKGSKKWRLPTIDEIRSIVTTNKLKKGGSCGLKDECHDNSCFNEEACKDDEPSKTLLYDFGYMFSGTLSFDYPYYDEEAGRTIYPDLWLLSTKGGYLAVAGDSASVRELFQRCVLDETLEIHETPYTDPETGLTWSDISSDYLTLSEANDYCYELSKGDFDHWWRVPTLDELKTLVRNCSNEEGSPCPVDVSGKYSALRDYDVLLASDSNGISSIDFWNAEINMDGNSDSKAYIRCVSDGSNPCADDPCNGFAHCNVVENEGIRTYECGCRAPYKWNGSNCESICSTDPCGSVLHSTGMCNPISETTYECKCASGYLWNGSACVNPCEGDPCTAESANSTGECTVLSAEEYKCSCNEDLAWYAPLKECVMTAM